MNTEQKTAWFIIGLFVFCSVLYLLMAPFLGWKPTIGVFGLFGFTGLSPLIFKPRKTAKKIAYDERDQKISEKAGLAAGMTSYAVFVLICMGTWEFYKIKGTEVININILPLIVLAGAITLFLVRSIVILICYHRGSDYAKR